jgi:hypothetical protein
MPVLSKVFKLEAIRPLVTGKSWKHVLMPESYSSVNHNKMRRLNNGKAHRKVSPKLLQRIKKLRQIGKLTYREIFERTGISASRVHVLCNNPHPYAFTSAACDHKVVNQIFNGIRQKTAAGQLTQHQAHQLFVALRNANQFAKLD